MVPTTMKAWVYTTHGGPAEVLQLVDRPVPTLQDDQVLVEVKCAALNPVGYKAMKYFPSLIVKKPATPEMDLSGVVVGAGKAVANFKEGDEVYGLIPGDITFKTGYGALAQYAPVSEKHLLKKNPNISWQEAAALPLTSLTAIHCLELAHFKEGNTVFVNGGSGGLGSVTVQIAKALGAHKVISSCSDRNVEFVKGIGADEVIPYNTEDVPKRLAQEYGTQKIDCIVDAFGDNNVYVNCESYLKKDGWFVNAGADFQGISGAIKMGFAIMRNSYLPVFLGGVDRKYTNMLMQPTQERVNKLGELVDSGKLKAVIDSTHSFENVKTAYERILTNRARGKVIVNVSTD